MPVLNFQKQFAPKVETWIKRHTIRAKRKNPIKPGDHLYLYTGMRTKACRKLGEADCRLVQDISISENTVKIDGQALYPVSVQRLAESDGFETVEAFIDFFRRQYGLPFSGDLIHW